MLAPLLPILLCAAAAAGVGPTRSLQFATIDVEKPPTATTPPARKKPLATTPPARKKPLATTPPARKKPLAVATSGGGYRAMFGAIGLARGLAEVGGWPQVTHLASNSGGTWFATMLQYSSDFHADLFDLSKPVEDIANELALNIGEAYRRTANEDGVLVELPEINFSPSCEGRKWGACFPVQATCATATTVASAMIAAFIAAFVPVPQSVIWESTAFIDWGAFVAETLVGATGATGDIMAPAAFANITYLFQAGMMVDTFLSRDVVACLKPLTTDPTTLSWLAPNGASTTEFPAAFVRAATGKAGPAGASGWYFGSVIDEFETATINPTQSCATANLKDSSPLELPAPSAEFGAAWSAAAAGFTSSPTQFAAYNDVLGYLPSTLIPCLPGTSADGPGAEQVAPPVIRDAEGNPIWRGNDGGSTDNLALSFAIGRMQEDCASPDTQLDCSDGLSVMVWDHDPYDFTFSVTLRRHFIEPGGGRASETPGTLHNVYWNDGRNTSAPSYAVFAGEYPPQSEWKPWFTIPGNATNDDADPSQLPEEDHPQYWIGELTTIDNPWYGVTAETKVKALFLKGNLLQNTFLPSPLLPAYTATHYARTAAAMASSSVDVFLEFFETAF